MEMKHVLYLLVLFIQIACLRSSQAAHDSNDQGPPHLLLASSKTNFTLTVSISKASNQKNVLWSWTRANVTLGGDLEAIPPFNVTIDVHPPGMILAHVQLLKPAPAGSKKNAKILMKKVFPLVTMRKRRKEASTRNLLQIATKTTTTAVATTKKADMTPDEVRNESEAAEEDNKLYPHWIPTLDLAMVQDMPSKFPRNQIPPSVYRHLAFAGDGSGNYYPILYRNMFWILSTDYIEMNTSTRSYPLRISFSPINFWKWSMQVSMDEAWSNAASSGSLLGGQTEKETDMIREMFRDNGATLLIVTMVVSVLHTIFDLLAFTSDVQFWRQKKSMVGMSVRSLVINCFFQTVIFLYLLDNETSMLILISSGAGVLIEYWKLTKAFQFHVNWRQFKLSWEIASTSGREKELIQRTQEHDTTATDHLLFLLLPLILGYAIYSLLYVEQKSFYSWFINSLVGFVYGFGFVLMTPQLFINYKMKSVAHMPWKAMVYKALNTFVDDLFAFVIRMPTLHRLACFRDDLVFFVYLYQKWVYKVDYSRENEFGQMGEENQVSESVKEK